MEHPKRIGDRTTLAIMLALERVGFSLLLPFGENTRYDLVIDDGHQLARVQCKTGRLYDGAVRFPACSSYAHHARPKSGSRRDYLDDIDFFAVYCAETKGVYLVPIGDVQVRTKGALRIDPPRNGQQRRIRYAAGYQIGVVATGGLAASPGAPGSSA